MLLNYSILEDTRNIPKVYRARYPGGKEYLVMVEWKVGDLT